MYCCGLGLQVLGSFEDHEGFDGVMLGTAGAGYHFEFTCAKGHAVQPTPTPEDLIVLYMPSEREWTDACGRMAGAGFRRIASFNPYWEIRGRTYEDCDGYRIVLQHAAWEPA
jgi:hypothetical protein